MSAPDSDGGAVSALQAPARKSLRTLPAEAPFSGGAAESLVPQSGFSKSGAK